MYQYFLILSQGIQGFLMGKLDASEFINKVFNFVDKSLHGMVYFTEELVAIMCSDAPHSCAREVYLNYVKLVLSVFYVVCQSLGELRHLVCTLAHCCTLLLED